MRVFYEFTNLNNTEAKIVKITSSPRVKGDFVEIPDELGKKFLEGKERLLRWKLVWDDVTENMVMKRKGEEVFDAISSGFSEVKTEEDPDVIIKIHKHPDCVDFVVSMYEPPDDPTMPLYFFVTKKGDPNVFYAEFSAYYYDTESRFTWDEPENEFSVFTKRVGLTCSLEVGDE